MQDTYNDVLKSFTQEFDEDNIETERLRSVPHNDDIEPAPLREAAASTRVDPSPDRAAHAIEATEPSTATREEREENGGERSPHHPAPSPASSSSSLTYVSVDPADRANSELSRRQRQSAVSAASKAIAFEPLLPEELTSRQPSPSPRVSAPRAPASTVPSPFLSAFDQRRTSSAAEDLGYGAATAQAQRPRQTRSDSLEPPKLDLGSPFEKLPPSAIIGAGHEGEREYEIDVSADDEWTKRFLEADRKLKASLARRQRQTKSAVEDADPLQRQANDDTDAAHEDGQELSASGQLHEDTTKQQTMALSGSSTPSPAEPELPSPSPAKKKKRSKRSSSKKQRTPRRFNESDESREWDNDSERGSVDQDMTVEKSLAMLPKWRPGRSRNRATGNRPMYSDIREEDDDEEDESQEDSDEGEETDYDE